MHIIYIKYAIMAGFKTCGTEKEAFTLGIGVRGLLADESAASGQVGGGLDICKNLEGDVNITGDVLLRS